MNDYQVLFNLVIGGALGALGWFARELWGAVKELRKEIANLRVELAKDYLPKNDFNRLAGELKEMLIRISDKLDTKVDK